MLREGDIQHGVVGELLCQLRISDVAVVTAPKLVGSLAQGNAIAVITATHVLEVVTVCGTVKACRAGVAAGVGVASAYVDFTNGVVNVGIWASSQPELGAGVVVAEDNRR